MFFAVFLHATCGPKKSESDWIIGSATNKPFFGAICDARIWNVARTEAQIKSGMRASVCDVREEEGLRGYWLLNESLGLNARDYSNFKHDGIIKDCTWKKDKRPFPVDMILRMLKGFITSCVFA